jgi:hypothetical protein
LLVVWEVWRDWRIETDFDHVICAVKVCARGVVCFFFPLFLLLFSAESLTGWAAMDCFSSLRGLLLWVAQCFSLLSVVFLYSLYRFYTRDRFCIVTYVARHVCDSLFPLAVVQRNGCGRVGRVDPYLADRSRYT